MVRVRVVLFHFQCTTTRKNFGSQRFVVWFLSFTSSQPFLPLFLWTILQELDKQQKLHLLIPFQQLFRNGNFQLQPPHNFPPDSSLFQGLFFSKKVFHFILYISDMKESRESVPKSGITSWRPLWIMSCYKNLTGSLIEETPNWDVVSFSLYLGD